MRSQVYYDGKDDENRVFEQEERVRVIFLHNNFTKHYFLWQNT